MFYRENQMITFWIAAIRYFIYPLHISLSFCFFVNSQSLYLSFKICFFFEENAFDENRHLKYPKNLSINKMGHGIITTLITLPNISLTNFYHFNSYAWSQSSFPWVFLPTKDQRFNTLTEMLQKAAFCAIHVYIQTAKDWRSRYYLFPYLSICIFVYLSIWNPFNIFV